MQSSKEQQEEIRKPSSVINAKKQRKTIEWERLEISLRKLEIPTKRTYHEKVNTIKNKNSMDLTEAEDIKKSGKNTQKNYTKKIFMTQITMMV